MTRATFLPSPLALFKLRLFGQIVHDALHATACLVGSVLRTPDYRDVDVRIMLDDQRFTRIFGDNGVWVANGPLTLANMALSALARDITGSQVDCQIQRRSDAPDEPRQPLACQGYDR
jgi:hypothetical protein